MKGKAEELAELETKIEDLKSRRPEHCHGTDGYEGNHSTSPELWAEIEELEERIKKLKSEVVGPASGQTET